MSDLLTFKRMITPVLIQIAFWIAVVVIVIGGLLAMLGGLLQIGRSPTAGISSILGGIALIILGPLVARIYAEILMVIFRINETLTDMSAALANIQRNTTRP